MTPKDALRWLMQVRNKDGKCLGYKPDFERLFKCPKNISWEMVESRILEFKRQKCGLDE